jgi:histidinol phosphatase-like PHP family hydrolase
MPIGIVDLHMHTLISDGELIPAELIQRARTAGYTALALTDHADPSNLAWVLSQGLRAAATLGRAAGLRVLAGIELTHVPPALIPGLIRRARRLGAKIVVVHGETPVEPVPRGTNRAAILGGADILAHPGLITPAEARLARQHHVLLELTSRAGHCLTNGHVARVAEQAGCALVVNSDTHAPRDLHTLDMIRKVVVGAGLPVAQVMALQANARRLVARAGTKIS